MYIKNTFVFLGLILEGLGEKLHSFYSVLSKKF
jgi:hypothetical protein